jgi:hypothetical protein
MHVMLNGVHARGLEAIERAPQGMTTEVRPGRRRRLPDRCRMPRGSRIDPLPSAEPASEPSAYYGDQRAAFGPPVCVERRNNATLALARYFLPPSPSALCPVSVHSARGFFCRTIA